MAKATNLSTAKPSTTAINAARLDQLMNSMSRIAGRLHLLAELAKEIGPLRYRAKHLKPTSTRRRVGRPKPPSEQEVQYRQGVADLRPDLNQLRGEIHGTAGLVEQIFGDRRWSIDVWALAYEIFLSSAAYFVYLEAPPEWDWNTTWADTQRLARSLEHLNFQLLAGIALIRNDDSADMGNEILVWNAMAGKLAKAEAIAGAIGTSKQEVVNCVCEIRKRRGRQSIRTMRGRGYWRPDAPPP